MPKLFSFAVFFLSFNRGLCASAPSISIAHHGSLTISGHVKIGQGPQGIKISTANESVELIGSNDSLVSRIKRNEDRLFRNEGILNQTISRVNQTESRLDTHEHHLSVLISQASDTLSMVQQQGQDLTKALTALADAAKQNQASINSLSGNIQRLSFMQADQSQKLTHERLGDKHLQQNLIQENMQTTKKLAETTSQALAKLSEHQAATKAKADQASRRLNQIENKKTSKSWPKLESESKRVKAQAKQRLSYFSEKLGKEALRLSKKLT